MKLLASISGCDSLHEKMNLDIWFICRQQNIYGDTIKRTIRVPYKNGQYERTIRGFEDDVDVKLDAYCPLYIPGVGSITDRWQVKAHVESGVAA